MATGVAIVLSGVLAFAGGIALYLLKWPPWTWLIDVQNAVLGAHYPIYTTLFVMLMLFVPIAIVVQLVRAGLGALGKRS